MSDVPDRARVVVIGAGIVGNCLAGHLARLGWTDMVLVDKGPLSNRVAGRVTRAAGSRNRTTFTLRTVSLTGRVNTPSCLC